MRLSCMQCSEPKGEAGTLLPILPCGMCMLDKQMKRVQVRAFVVCAKRCDLSLLVRCRLGLLRT